MTKRFETKLREKQNYGTGATRDAVQGKGRFDLISDVALTRVAGVFERGAENHGARNWEKGLPLSRMIDSAIRHIIQYKMSKYMPELRNEDHLSHSIWNLLGVMHTEEMIERGSLPQKLDDLPRYEVMDDCPKPETNEGLPWDAPGKEAPRHLEEAEDEEKDYEEKPPGLKNYDCEEDALFTNSRFVIGGRARRCMCNRKDGKYKCDKYKESFGTVKSTIKEEDFDFSAGEVEEE